MTDEAAEELIRMRLRVEQDIFIVRQLCREVARAVGLENQDQTRLATALSEVARLVVAAGPDAEVAFTVTLGRVPTLQVEMAHPVPGVADRIAQGRGPTIRGPSLGGSLAGKGRPDAEADEGSGREIAP